MPMNTSVKFFSNTMLNAPVLQGSTLGSLISVLDACLVNGWNLVTADSVTVSAGVVTANFSAGHPFVRYQVVQVAGAIPSGLNGEARVIAITTNTVKFEVTGVADGTATGSITFKTAPAGWVKAFSGTNKGAYKIDPAKYPTNTGNLVRFHHDTNYGARVVGYETMSDIDTGTGRFPTEVQIPGGLGQAISETGQARAWTIVADDRMFYIGVAAWGAIGGSYGYTWSAYGEYKSSRSTDAFNFLVAPTEAGPYGGGSYADDYLFLNQTRPPIRQYLPRAYDNLGGAVRFTTRSWPSQYVRSGGSDAPLPYPNGPNNGVYLCPSDIFESDGNGYPTQHRGTYPGVRLLPHRATNRIVPTPQTPYFATDVAGYAGKVVGFFSCIFSSSDSGVVAFDLTGPWEH